jgi:HlyD family secretion protein
MEQGSAMRKLLVLLILLIAGGGGGYWYFNREGGPGTLFRTAEVQRGDLMVTISATGTVEPEEVIDVGAQVLGKIQAFGKDPRDNGKVVDYGTPVEEGTVLAHIDDSLYAADVAQAAAALAVAEASVKRARADLEQLNARLLQAERNWKRAQELGPSRALSATDYESYEAAYETAKANVSVGQAAILQAERTVQQATATLERANTNLGYCTIRSPVKGVIIDRRVNIGQTVVASLNAPSLFLIAKDLRKMQVWAAVNEADIGNIFPGQAVSFTVDAYPGLEFHGEVGKIRLNATMTQNVVTYVVEINTDNSDGKLLPYLTANVRFEVARRQNVLMVPNAALRWSPAIEDMAPDVRPTLAGNGQGRGPRGEGRGIGGAGAATGGSEGGGRGGSAVPAPSGGEGRPPATAPAGRAGRRRAGSRPATQIARPTGRVWVRDGKYARPVTVHIGHTDGTMTEIESDRLVEGSEVIVGVQAKGAVESVNNPFAPQIFGPSRRQ